MSKATADLEEARADLNKVERAQSASSKAITFEKEELEEKLRKQQARLADVQREMADKVDECLQMREEKLKLDQMNEEKEQQMKSDYDSRIRKIEADLSQVQQEKRALQRRLADTEEDHQRRQLTERRLASEKQRHVEEDL